jgi:predicted Fe-S protein YdhL (DUF1289 family)
METPSPCIRNCCLDELDVCLGCGRTLNEITGWIASDDDQKGRILEAAKKRCETRASHLAQVAVKYGL